MIDQKDAFASGDKPKAGAVARVGGLRNFDARAEVVRPMTPDRQRALEAFKKANPGVDAQFDVVTGSANHLMIPGRFLAGADGPSGDVFAPVRRFIDANAVVIGHDSSALADSRVIREDVTARNGMRTVVWQQQVDAVPLYNTILKANLTKDGALVTLGSHFMPDAVAATQLDAPARAALMARPPVDEKKAVSLAAANLGDAVVPEQTAAVSPAQGAERKQQFAAPGLSDVVAQLAWLPMDAGSMRLTWDVTLMSLGRNEMFRVLVDVKTGEVLLRTSLTNDSDASYRVFADPITKKPYDSPAPLLPGTATPSGAQGVEMAGSLVTLEALDLTASPNGWIDDGDTQTLGNNVDAHTDTDANNVADLPRPTSPSRVFDFPIDLAQAPGTYKDAAVTHLFYINNWMHDQLYSLGFTESAGNFQTDNLGRGGNGNDAVQADAQDGSGTNNANFSTPADGSAPRMQMYVFTGPTPDRDGDFDDVIVLHEYAHGLSNRLVGGGVGISALATGGMGEGWSDFYGLALLADPASDPNAVYPGGSYATLNFVPGMTTNYYYGIRRYPYSTDMTKNPLTFRDIDPSQASPHTGIPLSPLFGSSNSNPSEVHNTGEVWCMSLWECRANLIAKHGPAGAQLILQFVTDGMKLSPANPNFLQSRDAVIQADLVDTGGANSKELWAAFAKRGMGASATAPASSTTTGVVEAFDIPDDLSVNPSTTFAAVGPVGGPFAPSSQVYTLTNTGTAPLTWTAGTSQPWLAVSPVGGTLAAGASTAVTTAFNPAASALPGGTYDATVNFTNVTSTAIISRNVSLVSGLVDYFTEIFDTSANDTDSQSWLFTPNGSSSFYGVTRSSVGSFPTDPTGGTPLTLSLDSFLQVTPSGGEQVKLYGVSYPSFFVSSKAYVTMGSGDFTWVESLAAHFSLPRIAGLFDDLNPAEGGTVSWLQFADRVAVTWQDVPEIGVTNSNNLQIEMYFDGRIRITCLGIAATDGLIGLSRGLGIPAGFIESDFSAYGTGGGTTLALGLTVPASATEGTGVLVGAGMVTLSAAQAADVVVSLTSSNPAEASVPATATVSAGQLSAPFDVTIGNDAVIDGPQIAIISASAAGFPGAAGIIAVQDDDGAGTLTLNAPASATEGVGAVNVTLTTSVAPGAPMTVMLSSDDTTEIQVPATVVIPAGQSSISFPITVVNDTLIDGTQSAGITAHIGGWTDGAATISVLDNETANLAISLPGTIAEGATGTGTVSISGTLPAPLIVSLLSSTTSRLTVPATATITTGSTSATFALTTVNNALTDGSAVVAVDATAGGFTGTSAPITVLDDEVHHFTINTIASPRIRGVPFSVTVTAKDVNNVTITTYTGAPALSAAGTTGPVTITPASVSGFVSGVRTLNVTANTFDTNVTLTVNDGAGHTGTSNAFDVTVGPLDHFAWSTVPSPQSAGAPFGATVTAQDAGNNTITGFTGTASLRGFAFGPSTSSIVITEVNPNTPDEIEFMNVSGAPVDVSGWTVYIYDFDTGGTSPISFVIPSGTTCAAGQIFRLQEVGTFPGTFPLFRTGGNINWTSSTGTPVGVLLRNGSGVPVDFVCAGALTAASVTSPSTIPLTQWTGAQITAPTNAAYGYLRIDGSDGNTSGNWTTNTPSIGTQNAGLIVPFAPKISVPILPNSATFAGGAWTGNLMVLQAATQMRLQADDGAGHTGDSNLFDSTGSPNAEIIVEQPALNILTDGAATVDLGIAGVGGDANVKTFIIRNAGAQVLTISGISGDGPDIASFSFPAMAGVAIPPAGSAAFPVQFTAASAGLKTAALHIGSDDGDENPFDITLTGTGAVAPEIKVEQPSGTERADGSGTIAFGISTLGVPVVKTLTIRNTGGAVLNLGSVTVGGANSAYFVAGAPSSPTVGVGGSATLNVTFTPGSPGAGSAVLHIVSSDPNENPYDIMLTGIGVAQSGLLHFLQDINATSAGQAITIANAAVMGSTVYFAATTAESGTELWKSDGTAAGTALVKDIFSGTGSSAPTNFLVIGSTLYFRATGSTNGVELWKSDGTTAGTVLVKDIFSGVTSSNPANLADVNGTLFFSATDTTANGIELWKSDGTAGGTVLVSNINAIANSSSSPANLTAVGSTLFFSANDGVNGVELWKSDGTAGGTVLVSNINPGSLSSSPANLEAVGSTLFFSASNGTNGIELWQSNGTSAGTVLVLDINAGTASSSPTLMVNAGGTLFFSALTSANGRELWKSNGTPAGTVLVKDINPGTASSTPSSIFAVGSGVYFSANNGTTGSELWRSDGTAAGTVPVADINPGTASSSPTNFVLVGGTLYFSATTAGNGAEVWKTGGTAANTVLVEDVNPGIGSSSPSVMFDVGGFLVFFANDGANGGEWWTSDGTSAGTNLVADITVGSGSAAPANFRVLNGAVLFSANNGVNGAELWRSDGVEGGTSLLQDIASGTTSSSPGAGVVIGSILYFPAFDSAGGTELWQTDGATAGATRVKDIFAGTTSSIPANLTNVGDVLYFSASDSTANGTELWMSDGSDAGTVPVANINPLANASSSPANLTDFNGTLFFTANDGTNGVELWKSNGAATVLVKDINPGSTSSSPGNFRVIGSTLYFTATTAAAGVELWKTDGSTAGTVIVSDIQAGTTSSTPTNLTVLGTTLYFSANGSGSGTELWKTDGTPAGTVLVADILPGTSSSSPLNMIAAGSTLYFSAFTSANGRELWKSNGTPAGTVMVADINTGTLSSSPSNLTNVYGTLYFSASTAADGAELWKSDGTSAGTMLAAGIRPGPLSSSPTNLTALSNRLLFSATGPDLGTELWMLDLPPEIMVEQPSGVPLADGVLVWNSGAVILGSFKSSTFTVRNIGGSELSGLAITKNGAHNGDFTIGSLGASTLGAGESTTFTVTFMPGAAGARNAAIHIASIDSDENPFDVSVTGTGLTRLEGWRVLYFGNAANSGNGADSNDFEFDGMRNFIEFCLHTDPTQPSQLSQTLIQNGVNLEFTYTRAKAAVLDGVVFRVKWNDDLTSVTWSTLGVSEMIMSDNGVEQVVKATLPAGINGRRFVRLEAAGP